MVRKVLAMVATRDGILLVCFFFLLFGANATRAAVPEPCSAVGYNNLSFFSDFSDGNSFDQNGTYRPGFKWYRWNWFGVVPDPVLAEQLPDGSVSARGSFGGHIVSAAASPKQGDFVGTAFGGGACVEVTLRFDPVRETGNLGHPSFWAMAKEHLDGSGDDQWPGRAKGFSRFAEWDILEYYKVPEPGFLSSWVEWYGPYINSGPRQVDGRDCRRPFCKTAWSFSFHRGAVPLTTDWSQWQVVVGVWTPASADQPGCLRTYLGQRLLAEPYCWSPLGPSRDNARNFDFSIIDRQHMVLVISGGEKPIYVRSVRVFQGKTQSNITR
jgi:hypothetical protein